MVDVLIVENLWFAFGAHLLHIKWAMMYALKRNYRFYYKNNNYPIFVDGTVEYYFKSFSTITDSELKEAIQHKYIKPVNAEEILTWKPDAFDTFNDFYQYLLEIIYRPSKFVEYMLTKNKLLQEIIINKIKYIGLHIRLSDKTAGPYKESDFIPLEKYVDSCIQLRNELNINTIVLCTDTIDAVNWVEDYNSKLKEPFIVLYNTEEIRCKDDWTDSFSVKARDNKLSLNQLQDEMITCFINFEYLLKAEVLVGNFDSGFILAAVEYRNNNKDRNVNTNPPLWG
jgi:hypothetical protein